MISPGNEVEYVFTIVSETWVSVDIPLTDFAPPVDLTDVFQFKVEGNGDIWFDNLYFWNETACSQKASDWLARATKGDDWPDTILMRLTIK